MKITRFKLCCLALVGGLFFMFNSCEKEAINESQNINESQILQKKPTKVDLCHFAKSDNTWEVISVKDKAVTKHLKHGDVVLVDADGDGYVEAENECVPGGDCNDTDAAINPGAAEVCDGIDNNCDGSIDEGFDVDGDGYTTCDGDCDDDDADINPDATEVCDGIDNNCDGIIDEGFDVDGDGYTTCEGDCDDTNNAINPGATEICDNGIDDNCDGEVDEGCEVVCPCITIEELRSIDWCDRNVQFVQTPAGSFTLPDGSPSAAFLVLQYEGTSPPFNQVFVNGPSTFPEVTDGSALIRGNDPGNVFLNTCFITFDETQACFDLVYDFAVNELGLSPTACASTFCVPPICD